MRIAYIGNFEPEYSTENDVRKAFESLGHEVIKIQENQANVGSVYSTVLEPRPHSGPEKKVDLLLITTTWDDALDLREWLGLMKMCAKAGLPTATLHLDTFWGTSRDGREWWRSPMFHTAYIFTADGDYQDEWKLLGKNHIWLPPAVRHDAAHLGIYKPQYDCDVAFVGSNGEGYHEDVWGYRKELVDNLRAMCQRRGWKFRNPGGDQPKVLRGEDMNNFYASAKVTVGDSLCLKKEASHYWSDRVPEATGRGGFLIMPQIDEIEEIYRGTVPMYPWGDYEKLEDLISSYLGVRNTKLREEMKKTAQKITAEGHTYVDRVQTILKEVGL